MLIEISFKGGLADQHRVPAYDGTRSLEGLTRSVLMISNFLVEGRVRRRDFGYTPLVFNMVAQRPGSFQTVYEILYDAAVIGGPIAGGLASGIAGNMLTDLIKTVYRRATGGSDGEVSEPVRELEESRGGDIAALVDAVEPAIRLGHNVINHGVMNISIGHGKVDSPSNIANLDRKTKEYMWESVLDNNVRLKLFSIASFNANQGTGRAFDLEEGRSIPYELIKDIDRESVNKLLESISSYARRRRLGDNIRSAVAIRYTSVDALDGRIKKILILGVRGDISEF